MSLKNNFKNHRTKWQRMARLWARFSKPGRPSQDDIKNYNELLGVALGKIKNPKVLVLGVTPEIRNLLYKYKNTKVYCVDMTIDMYRAMDVFIRYQNKREKFIQSNWLSISRKVKNIDVVIGDYVSGNIASHFDKFLLEIKKVLKPGGYFIVRDLLIADSTKPIKSISLVFRKVVDKFDKGKLSLKDASSEFANEFVLKSWFLKNNNTCSISYFAEGINRLFVVVKNSGTKSEKKVLNYFKNSWWQINDKYWTITIKAKQERIYSKHFKIKQILYSKDYKLSKESPIYLLQK